jgi:DNA invertase Pin-like site-specific DNA recombinase
MARPRKATFVPEWEDEWFYLYARISNDQKKKKTRNGRTREAENIASQLSRLHQWCDRNDVPENRRVVFSDNDITASRFGGGKEREDYGRLIDRIGRSRRCTVISVEQSRLVRQEIEGVQLKNLMLAHEMRIVLLDGEIDLTSSAGDLQWTFALFKARQDSEDISRRSKAKYGTDREDLGIHKIARIPFGYKDTALTVIDEAQKAELHKMRSHILNGRGDRTGTLGECARMLAADGFVSPVTGRPYSKNAVTHMLRNAVYAGWVVHKGARVRKSTHIVPIFTDVEFDTLQEKLDANSAEAIRQRGGRVSSGRVHLLSGFLRCGGAGCGAIMEVSRGGREKRRDGSKGAQRPQRWQCSRMGEGQHTSRDYATVATAVDLFVQGRLRQRQIQAVDDAAADPRAIELDQRIATLEGRLRALSLRYADDTDPITDDQYFTDSALIRDKITKLSSERAAMERHAVASLPPDALNTWTNPDPAAFDAKRAILDELVSHVIVLPVGYRNGPNRAPLSSVQVYPRRAVATAEVVTTSGERRAS